MIIARLQTALLEVGQTYEQLVAGMPVLARSLTKDPELALSRLLLGSSMLQDARPGPEAVSACRALELLDQALVLGNAASAYNEEKLLVADFLYAQAIDQVAGLQKPIIIDLLAGAIMTTARDRVLFSDLNDRSRLAAAALEIGLLLGAVKGDRIDALRVELKPEARLGAGEIVNLLPEGLIKSFLCERPTVAVKP